MKLGAVGLAVVKKVDARKRAVVCESGCEEGSVGGWSERRWSGKGIVTAKGI